MTSLQKRIVAALIMAPLFIAVIIYGGIAFSAVIILVSVIAYHEYLPLAKTQMGKFLGLFYVAIPALSLIWLREHGIVPVLMVILSVWMTDCGAYFTGRSIGGPKLAPTISPNKTWSGLMGGVICSALVVGALAYYYQVPYWGAYFGVGAVLAVISQLGDLFESHMKRRAGVKDSGTIIPGHGGVLDRIDGLLTAVPCFAIFIWLVA
jgi:phosphatidate cytidylyltransferase